MTAAIRADASERIGTGHVIRCMALAVHLRERGADVTFVCREHPGHLCDVLEAKGFVVRRLPRPADEPRRQDNGYASWLGVSQEEDAADTERAMPGIASDWIVVDHYALDRRWETRVRGIARRILCIDDVANRPHDCDLLLDQNRLESETDPYKDLVGADCEHLLGPRYALLRPEFRQVRARSRIRTGAVRRILVFFGGADASNETAKALDAIAALDTQDLIVDVVVGSLSRWREQLLQQRDRWPWAAFYSGQSPMAELMDQADLSIGAAGSASWERCCVGLPSVILCLTENQRAIAETLDRAGAVRYLGASSGVAAAELSTALDALRRDPERVRDLSRNSAALVDGLGAERVAGRLAAVGTS